MKLLRTFTLAASLIAFAATGAQAENFSRKVDGFDFLVDYSGSMMMSFEDNKQAYNGNKLDAAKATLAKVNGLIPDLGYEGSLHTFSPASTVVPYAAWDQAGMNAGIESLNTKQQIFDRRTGMGDGMMEFASAYGQMATPSAVIIASDGNNNIGIDPVQEARELLQANPSLCIHVISFADTEEGQAVLNEIAALKDCSVAVKGLDLLASDEAAEQFVQDVFYYSEEVIVLRGVNFAFDSYKLDNTAKAILDEAAMLIMDENKTVMLEGWTDSIGTDAYNKTLSMNRAKAVEMYLESKGVSASKLSATGMGESFKFDNKNEEGRYLNRRTEILFQ